MGRIAKLLTKESSLASRFSDRAAFMQGPKRGNNSLQVMEAFPFLGTISDKLVQHDHYRGRPATKIALTLEPGISRRILGRNREKSFKRSAPSIGRAK